MIRRETTWGQVEKHSYIADKNGETWRVLFIGEVKARIRNRAGRTVSIDRPAPDHPVVTFEPTEAECVQLLQSTLGATIVEEISNT